MNLCLKSHDEIVYDGKNCPVCELVSEIESLKQEMSDHVCKASE
jgi:hypothetical protein